MAFSVRTVKGCTLLVTSTRTQGSWRPARRSLTWQLSWRRKTEPACNGGAWPLLSDQDSAVYGGWGYKLETTLHTFPRRANKLYFLQLSCKTLSFILFQKDLFPSSQSFSSFAIRPFAFCMHLLPQSKPYFLWCPLAWLLTWQLSVFEWLCLVTVRNVRMEVLTHWLCCLESIISVAYELHHVLDNMSVVAHRTYIYSKVIRLNLFLYSASRICALIRTVAVEI